MKKQIEMKLIEIKAKMDKIESEHEVYYLRTDWKILHGQREVLAEVLQEA